jgi:hypothetical protein
MSITELDRALECYGLKRTEGEGDEPGIAWISDRTHSDTERREVERLIADEFGIALAEQPPR